MTLTIVRPLSAAGVWVAGRPAVRFVNAAGIVAPGTGIRVIRSASGPGGTAGKDAKVSVGFMASGPFTARQWIMGLVMSGSGVLTNAASHARAFIACQNPNIWSVTKNGTFAQPGVVATPAEIAAALFATISFPSGAGDAVWSYVGGTPGVFADDDRLEFWESATPDARQANTTVIPAGA